MSLNIEENKFRFRHLLYRALGEKAEKLLDYLELNGFFIAPCSAGHHLNVDGGLCEHSLMVCEFAMHLTIYYSLPYTIDTIITAALLHDVFKMFQYERVKGKWQYKDDGSKGKISKSKSRTRMHGEWAVEILEKFITLTNMEKEMIKWHMGPYTDYYDGHKIGDFLEWSKDKTNSFKHPALLLYFCDHFSTMFLED